MVFEKFRAQCTESKRNYWFAVAAVDETVVAIGIIMDSDYAVLKHMVNVVTCTAISVKIKAIKPQIDVMCFGIPVVPVRFPRMTNGNTNSAASF